VPRWLRKGRTVACALNTNAWTTDVQGALTFPILIQFLQLHQRLSVVLLRQGVQDSFSWRCVHLVVFLRCRPNTLCLRAKRRCWVLKSFGSLIRRTSATSSSGSCSIAGVGLRRGCLGMASKLTGTARSAAKARGSGPPNSLLPL
jgi:hypothetical protein